MPYYPPWTEEEFRQLLANEDLSNEALSKLIGRTPGAISWVRSGVVKWRRKRGDISMLSQMMIRVLRKEQSMK